MKKQRILISTVLATLLTLSGAALAASSSDTASASPQCAAAIATVQSGKSKAWAAMHSDMSRSEARKCLQGVPPAVKLPKGTAMRMGQKG